MLALLASYERELLAVRNLSFSSLWGASYFFWLRLRVLIDIVMAWKHRLGSDHALHHTLSAIIVQMRIEIAFVEKYLFAYGTCQFSFSCSFFFWYAVSLILVETEIYHQDEQHVGASNMWPNCSVLCRITRIRIHFLCHLRSGARYSYAMPDCSCREIYVCSWVLCDVQPFLLFSAMEAEVA